MLGVVLRASALSVDETVDRFVKNHAPATLSGEPSRDLFGGVGLVPSATTPPRATPRHGSASDRSTGGRGFADTPIRDVLITGGDPMVLSDARLDHILSQLATIDHVFRIRIGTRIPVVLPFRITDSFISMLAKHVKIGRREICFITHFEHPYEITPEAAQAVTKLRKTGVSVYNQQVYTFETSRRFETVALRRGLRLIGVDPYYTFITKGKEETDYYRVPIARILQERKEEARLFPGLDRTDEPVFNVPRLGKNHLRAWQDHRLVMILPDGRRIYEFHPWEKYITPIPPYNYIDVSIYEYLERLKERGEDVDEYRTIWYYY
jgi:lysine 2,3-aminomutase